MRIIKRIKLVYKHIKLELEDSGLVGIDALIIVLTMIAFAVCFVCFIVSSV